MIFGEMKQNRWFALCVIGISVFFSLSLWFSASVITSQLKVIWNVTPLTEAWLSASIPTGFVIGAFISAYFGIADRFNVRKLFALSALLGALFNFLIIFSDQAIFGIALRILTGITLAGVYPPAIKLIAQWFPKQRGIATGIIIAALTLGTALPHLITILIPTTNNILVLAVSSMLSIIAAAMIFILLKDAPVSSKRTPFSMGMLVQVFRNKPVMLANYGYFGHMWELYAMWTWLPVFLTASFTKSSSEPWMGTLVSFLSIGVAGGIGCILGGIVADKIGRSNLTVIAMAISAFCAIGIGMVFGHLLWLTIVLALIWGMAVIADSAQFSVAVSEFAEVEYVGTALTFQMCIGFLITIVSINIIPMFQRWVGWEWVFVLLSIGPILGIVSMIKFKSFERDAKVKVRKTAQ
ncbi:MFS transporter [Alteribacillus iranensis]|uniref:Sugar phosphate permease n=1 Tax=Alteribacillus iranensis TaxID=930128 RepID=A0A1I2ELX0_9BACI|nr:MFS transporter [Alteribacillus iranensis]SFE93230.1 Sugar phosphate permease [Alteribacillus iranensis]